MDVKIGAALLVIAAFLRYLKRFGLAPFGVYRILLGIVVLVLLGGAPTTPSPADGPSPSSPASSPAPEKSQTDTAPDARPV